MIPGSFWFLSIIPGLSGVFQTLVEKGAFFHDFSDCINSELCVKHEKTRMNSIYVAGTIFVRQMNGI